MLLIALSGGNTPAEREAIADRLIASGKGQLASFAQATPKSSYGAQRARILSEVLEGLDVDSSPAQGLLIVHCMTEEEAQIVRAKGGTLWHLYNRPSSQVVIRNGDTMVTDGEKGFKHVRAPLEALSEAMLSQLAKGRAPLAAAAVAGLAGE